MPVYEELTSENDEGKPLGLATHIRVHTCTCLQNIYMLIIFIEECELI